METVLKRGEIYGFATTIAMNVDEIIPTPLGLMQSGSVIQNLSVFLFITTFGSCQARLLPTMGHLAALLEEEALMAATCLLKIRHKYLS